MAAGKAEIDPNYDLVSSPMMINELFKRLHLPDISNSDISKSLNCTQDSQMGDDSFSCQSTKDQVGLTTQEKVDHLTTPPINQVSVYSGPLYNNRMATADQSTASLADRLANARMMQKSGYTWDPAGSCAKIRLGDGSILQNLYPSHSHVKLRSGAVERIDAYCQRMMSNADLLREITMIKAYEYNQWSRTRPLNPKDYENCKSLPVEKLESKSTQPSWNTVRPMNASLINLGAKNRIFSYEDLAAKFSQPKFLKRMGFIGSETDCTPQKRSPEDSSITSSTASECSVGATTTSSSTTAKSELTAKVQAQDASETKTVTSEEQDESDELSSDDEEYHNNLRDESLLDVPPERVPSSKRSNRQQLAIYKDDMVIGSKKVTGKASGLAPNEQEYLKNYEDKPPIPRSTVKNMNDVFNQNQKVDFQPSSRNGSFQSRPIRRDSLKLDAPAKVHRVDKDFVRFSQPVCLCPKLSKETLNSFYSPTMQKYLSNNANGFLKCQLHSNIRHLRTREKIVLKSL